MSVGKLNLSVLSTDICVGLDFVLYIDFQWLLRIVSSPVVVNAAVSLQCCMVGDAVVCCGSAPFW